MTSRTNVTAMKFPFIGAVPITRAGPHGGTEGPSIVALVRLAPEMPCAPPSFAGLLWSLRT